MKKKILLAATFAFIMQPVFAGDKEVNQLKYNNDGAYQAESVLRWQNEDGSRQSYHKGLLLDDGQSYTYTLSNCIANENCVGLDSGDRVWLEIKIRLGDKKSCRHKGPDMYYYPDGDRVRYVTKGTTNDNNQCKYKGLKVLD